jgi:hypothetical protein
MQVGRDCVSLVLSDHRMLSLQFTLKGHLKVHHEPKIFLSSQRITNVTSIYNTLCTTCLNYDTW